MKHFYDPTRILSLERVSINPNKCPERREATSGSIYNDASMLRGGDGIIPHKIEMLDKANEKRNFLSFFLVYCRIF